jgi:hypothetical protein
VSSALLAMPFSDLELMTTGRSEPYRFVGVPRVGGEGLLSCSREGRGVSMEIEGAVISMERQGSAI